MWLFLKIDLHISKFFVLLDMKQGMMDVGIFCKESRFSINPEKGEFPIHYIQYTYTYIQKQITSCSVLHLCFLTDCTITKFLNRILGLEVYKQNSLFQYFSDNFDYLIEKDKKEGKYDMGILGKPSCNVLFNAVPSFKELLDCNTLCPIPVLFCFFTDLAPGNDEISNETQERFLTPGNPQEGQVILYKVSLD